MEGLALCGRGDSVDGLLLSGEVDPTDPEPGQYWQARGHDAAHGAIGGGGGAVRLIDHLFHGGEFVSMDKDRTFYVTAENLKRFWRCVDHVPRAALHVGGHPGAPLVSSWFEYVVALEIVTQRRR